MNYAVIFCKNHQITKTTGAMSEMKNNEMRIQWRGDNFSNAKIV